MRVSILVLISLSDAAGFIAALVKIQGLIVAYPEEIAYRKVWIAAYDVIPLENHLKRKCMASILKKFFKKTNEL